MFRTGIPRRLIALVAAYGLALQAMLAAVAAVTPALDQIICAADTDPGGAGDTRHLPTPGHEPGCPLCPLVCGGVAALPRVDVASAPSPGFSAIAPPPPMFVHVKPVVARAGLSRAPPA